MLALAPYGVFLGTSAETAEPAESSGQGHD
jgi:hypothetical protein